jgi:acetyl-CoA carboxylase carboxyl transferase subunit alpha
MNDTLTSGSAAASGSGLLEFEKPLLQIQQLIAEMERAQRDDSKDLAAELKQQRARYKTTLRRLYTNLTPWETVLVARHSKRPLVTDYLTTIFRDVCELHGDRAFGDDRAIITAFARIGPHRVMVVGQNKGRDIKERVNCNFGCAHPEGYRKAMHKMRLAEKYALPVVCLIDTQGAYPGIGAEERGIHYAIAKSMMDMSRLRTPIVSIVIGEGGSGGALGLGVADRVAMLQHAFYSVISPEGCAAILWKTAEKRKHAAEALKLVSKELLTLNLIDDVIAEPVGGAHRDPEATVAGVEQYVVSTLTELRRFTPESLVSKRQDRLRKLGAFFESPSETAAAEQAARARGSTTRASRVRSRLTAPTRVPVP